MASLPIFGLIETVDFPPVWELLDTHAAWHAFTIPLGILWGSFLLDDLAYTMDHNKLPRLQA
jgi:post-GPI attachment to proteins factor 3